MEKQLVQPMLKGYQARPVTMEDLGPAVEFFNTVSMSTTGTQQFSIDHVRMEWQMPVMHLATDTMAVFTPEQQMAGYIEYWANKPYIRLMGWSSIHPDHWGRGIDDYLVGWLVARARKDLDLAPPDARLVLHNFIESSDQNSAELLARHGYQMIRSSYIMKIDFTEPPQPPVLPDGLVIRSISGKDEERAALYTGYDAFKDHWGRIDEPFDNYYERRMMFIQDDPLHDPSLWFIALDGEEVAGISLCSPQADEDPDMGWVQTLGVRRPWRKRGVGLALLQHSFVEHYRRGRKSAGLGVDASSLTGATRLYEKAGMRVLRQINLYELELRPGEDRMTKSIS